MVGKDAAWTEPASPSRLYQGPILNPAPVGGSGGINVGSLGLDTSNVILKTRLNDHTTSGRLPVSG